MDDRNATAGRSVVATFPRYAEAQRAVDYLSDQQFPVERVAIVAEGLRIVEQVTGRLTLPRAALSGAISGALVGILFGLLLGLLNLAAPATAGLVLAGYGLVFGAIVGAIIAAVGFVLRGGQRDFSSVGGLGAERYNVLVDAEFAPQAQRLLQGMPRT